MNLEFDHIEVMDDITAEILRKKSLDECMRIAESLFVEARNLISDFIRYKHPDWDDLQVMQETIRQMHGTE